MTREHYDKLRHRAQVLRALADAAGATEPERDSARRKLAEIEAELAEARVEPAFSPSAAPMPKPAPFAQVRRGRPSAHTPQGYDVRDNIPFTNWSPRPSTAPTATAAPPPPPPPVEPVPLPPSVPTSPVGHYGVPSSAGAPRRGGIFGNGGPFGGGGGIF